MKSKIRLFTILPIVTTLLCHAQGPYLVGMTRLGGNAQQGNIFRLDVSDTSSFENYRFGFGSDGINPWGALIRANNGLFYGLTESGGTNGGGVILSYNATSFAETVLHNFASGYGPDGSEPYGTLMQAQNGLLYGTTLEGGAFRVGSIFSYDIATDSEQVLYSFYGFSPYAALVQAHNGMLYGMTFSNIFRFNIDSSTTSDVHDFGNGNDASDPYGALMLAKDSLLYGMSRIGGSNNQGAIFSFNTIINKDSVLYSFTGNANDGRYPFGSLIQANNGLLYGMTSAGGNVGNGIIFSYNITTGTITDIHDFEGGNDGLQPLGDLMQASDGKLYGMTSAGGPDAGGIVFSFNPQDSIYSHIFDFSGTNGFEPYFGALVEYEYVGNGINNIVVDNKLSLFPNPSTGQFSIKGSGNQTACPVEVYNLIGEKIYQSILYNSQGIIDLSSHPDGMYFIRLKTDEDMETQKVLILK